MTTFEYTISTKKDFAAAVESVVTETEKAGFRVLHIHDVQATLATKNFTIDSLKIIEICNAKNAYDALTSNILIGLFLPCKINVYVQDGKTYISGLMPSMASELFRNPDITTLMKRVEQTIKQIIERSK